MGLLRISRLTLWGTVGLLIGVGLLSRIAPLFDQGGRLLRQWPSEDGYLMLTIARNLALGRGMSVAEGTIPTNGTQPLFTLLQAAGFAIVGGDRVAGVAIAQGMQIGFSLVAAGLLFALARQVLHARPYRSEIAALAAGLWFASALAIPHTMNCLETGLYVTLILLSVYVWHRQEITRAERDRFSSSVLGVGGVLGLTFWARIDAVFLIAAITLWHALPGVFAKRQQLVRRILESVVVGLTTIAIASPWLLYNQLNFGSIMPVSGTAQSADAAFGSNASEVPSTLFEYATVVLPIPESLEKTGPVLVGASLFILLYLGVLGRFALKMNRQERVLLAVVGTFATFLIVYYGLLFGAAHFVDRYLFPLSPFLALSTTAMLACGWDRWFGSVNVQRGLSLVGLTALGLAIVLNVRLYRLGSEHAHFQVVEWVQQNVPEQVWVGAVQTGTLGFFHDRTINLDGKVNPDALAAKLERRIPEYVVEQRFDENGGQIEFLVDWVGIAQWAELEPLAQHFELIVEDRRQNLAVLARRS